MKQDKLIELAKEAGLISNSDLLSSDCSLHHHLKELTKFADLVSANAITSMQTEQPVGEIVTFGDAELKEVSWRGGKMPEAGTKLYTHPAPFTSMQGDSEPVGYTSAHLLTTVSDGDTGCFYKEKDDEYNIPLFTHGRVKGVSDEQN